MKKSISALLVFIMLCLCTTAFAEDAAKMYMSETFSGDNAAFIAGGWSEVANGTSSFDVSGGTLKILANGSPAAYTLRKQQSLPTEYYAEFALRLNEANNNQGANIGIYANGYRIFMRIQPNRIILRNAANAWDMYDMTNEVGTWTTFILHVTDSSMLEVSRKAEGEESFTQVVSGYELPAMAGSRVDLFIESGDNLDVEFDYFRVYTGFIADSQQFSCNGEAVERIPNGVLDATTEVVYGSSGGGVQNVTAILVLLDKNGMILCCDYKDATLEAGSSAKLTVSVDTSPYYDNLTGGSAELYLWDSIDNMQPIMSLSALVK